MIHLYRVPSWIQSLWRTIVWRGERYIARSGATKPCVYLTFDDGPIPEVTPAILAILRSYNVKATFFQVGENIHKYPQVAQQVQEDGHQVGNHTYNHLQGLKSTIRDYLANTACFPNQESLIEHRTSKLFRPPHGWAKPSQLRALRQQGYRIVLWDVITYDYERQRTAEEIVRTVRRYVRPGSIILFHDSLKSAHCTPEALPQVIEYLLSHGYAFCTL